MKKWQAAVWRFTIAGKSKQGNWWESKFRFWWTARIVTKIMAVLCDWNTPSDHYGIAWGIRESK